MNTNQLLQMLRTSPSPQQFTISYIEQQVGNDPFFSNLIALAKNGRGNEIETIARNVMKEKGLDFDTEFNAFKNNLKL